MTTATIDSTGNVRTYGAVGDGTTDDSAAIQAAIDDCPVGGTVDIPSTSFGLPYRVDDTLTISKPITMRGSGTLKKLTTGTALLDITSGNVTVDGLTLTNVGTAGTAVDGTIGVHVHGPSYANPLARVVLSDLELTGWAHSGVWAVNVTRMLISGCSVSNTLYSGIMLLSITDSIVVGNTVTDIIQKAPVVNTYGIAVSDVENTDAGRSRNVIVAYNVVKYVRDWEGLDTHGGEGIVFVGNEVIGCRDGIALVSGNSTRITAPIDCMAVDNLIDPTGAHSPRHAIRLYGNASEKAHATIRGNRIIPGYTASLGGGTFDTAKTDSDQWISATPALYGINIGNGTRSCRYTKNGRTVTCKFHVKFGDTTTFSPGTVLGFYAPVPLSDNIDAYEALGAASLVNASAGGTGRYSATAVRLTAADNRIFFLTGSSTVQTTVPTAWAPGDSFSCTITYETDE